MNRLLKVLMAPLLVIALLGTAVFLGLTRPGAISHAMDSVVSQSAGREALARAFVDVMVDEEAAIIGVLISKNRDEVEAIVAEVLGQPQQREQLGAAAQEWIDAMLRGDAIVEIDPRPLFRPIYTAVDQLLPLLNLGEEQLADLEPLVLGADDPLPDLRLVRNLTWAAMATWLLWLLLGYALLRRTSRRAWHTIGVQLLSVGMGMALVVFAAPRLISRLADDAQMRELTDTLLSSLSQPGLLLGGLAAISGTLILVMSRRAPAGSGERAVSGEGALAGESAPDSQ